MKFFLLFACVSCFLFELACYKGTPAGGNIDYPPEPPAVERHGDAGIG